jgi:hypothetical protein
MPSFGFGFKPQIVFIESCISAKTVVAPISKVIIPIAAANPPLPSSATLLIIPWICSAASLPTKCQSGDRWCLDGFAT